METLFALDAPAPSHPAKYTDALLVTMAAMRYGANSEARIPYESVILFRLEATQ